MLIILLFIIGLAVGVLLNLLADELPFRRGIAIPTYYDGTPRPFSAWSGITLFLTGQRLPLQAQPDKSRQRLYFPEMEAQQPDLWERALAEYQARPLPLTWRYPLVELLSGLAFAWVGLAAPQIDNMDAAQLIVHLLYVALLILNLTTDVEHRLILRIVTYPSIVLAFADSLLLPHVRPNFNDALSGAALGFGIFSVLYLGGFIFVYVMGALRNQRIQEVAFGWGDVMLITFSGAVLGFAHTIIALFITVFLGALGAFVTILASAVRGKRYSAFTAIPYGPYIIIATFAMLLYGDPIRIAMIGY
ncbi:MAG: A24 family peptidase [Anaerolineae bacterium]|nr:A24 family peptidase [Anaerolineae bacterium]